MAKTIPGRKLGIGSSVSIAELAQLTAKKGRYKTVKRTGTEGLKFDSAGEADRYLQLRAAAEQGHIQNLRRQVRFDIIIGGVPVVFDSGRQMHYLADFVYVDPQTGREVIEDWKGHRTDVYKIKKALMRAMGHTITEKQAK